MSITNISKPVSSVANQAKIGDGETFETITTTFNTETRSFNQMASKISNTDRVTNSDFTNQSKP